MRLSIFFDDIYVKGQGDSDVICIKQIRPKVFAQRDVNLDTNELENITDKFRADLIIRSLLKRKISVGAGGQMMHFQNGGNPLIFQVVSMATKSSMLWCQGVFFF